MIALAWLLALAAADGVAAHLCAPVVPAAEPDPAGAAEYRAVAEAEEAAGREGSAAAAWRAAAALEPADPRAAAALHVLCRRPGAEAAFQAGLAHVKAGRCDAALAPLEAARAAGDHAAALLAGVCRYEAGEDDAAGLLLAEAEQDPGTRASARFFLGLLALRAGRGDEAVAMLESASGDDRLAPLAAELGRAARRSGRLVASLAFESGWDSNVELEPGAALGPSGASGGSTGLAAALTFAPGGERGPFARAAATLTELWSHDAYDLRAASAVAGWQLSRGDRSGLLELGWDHRRLGDAPLLWEVHAAASGRTRLGGRAIGSLAWRTSYEDYLDPGRGAYGGLRHALEAELAGKLLGFGVAAAWRVEHDGAEEDALAAWEAGPRVSARRELSRAVSATLDLGWAWRRADAEDPILGERRQDQLFDAAAAVEVDLGPHFTLRLACTGRRAVSNIGGLTYSRLFPSVGLTYVRGLL